MSQTRKRTRAEFEGDAPGYIDVYDPKLTTSVEAHNYNKRTRAKFVDTNHRYTPWPHSQVSGDFLDQGVTARHEWGTH